MREFFRRKRFLFIGAVVSVPVLWYMFVQMDAYLLSRADQLLADSNTPTLTEEPFVPFSDAVLADARKLLEENVMIEDGASDASVAVGTSSARSHLATEALLLVMREAVMAYDDAGWYAQEAEYSQAYDYLRESEKLLRELHALITYVLQGPFLLTEEERAGIAFLSEATDFFLVAVSGAQQFVQGIVPDIDLAQVDADARSSLSRARALLEKRDELLFETL